MAAGDIYKLIPNFRFGGSEFRPGLHFEVVVGTSTLSGLIASWRGAVETAMLAGMSNVLQLVAYDAVDVRPGLLATRHEEITPPLAGAIVGEATPPQDAILFSLKTDSKSLRARGRVYWPGLPELSQESGNLLATAQTTWGALIAAITGQYVGTSPVSGFRLVNYSKEQLDPPKPPPVFKPRPGVIVTPVTNLVLDTIIRSQRRRQTGVGQ